MKRRTRVLFGFFLAVAFSAGSLASAHAATEDIPPDVEAAYSVDALAALRNAEETSVTVDETGGPDFSTATSFGVPRQIQLWSTDLIYGKSSGEQTTLLEEWLAPILGPEGQPLGTYRAWRQAPGSQAELAGYNDDIELAGALQKIDARSALVSDPAIAAWYVIDDGLVTALNQSAAREVPYPASIDEVAGLVSARYAEAIKNSEESGEGAAGGMTVDDRRPWYYGLNPWILGAGSVLLLAAAIGLIWWIRSARTGRGGAPTRP